MILATRKQNCYRCDTENWFYPINIDGNTVHAFACHHCNRHNLIPGWEVSFQSEEDAMFGGEYASVFKDEKSLKLNNNFAIINNTDDVVVNHEPVTEVWTKTSELQIVNGILQQLLCEKSSGKVRWENVPVIN